MVILKKPLIIMSYEHKVTSCTCNKYVMPLWSTKAIGPIDSMTHIWYHNNYKQFEAYEIHKSRD